MLTKATIVIAVVVGAATSATAQTAPTWDNPPGKAWQDIGNIEAGGGTPVLTPRGYRSAQYGGQYRSYAGTSSRRAFAFAPQTSSRQGVRRARRH